MFSQSCFFEDTATTEIYTLSLHDALSDLQVVAAHGPPDLVEGAGVHDRVVRRQRRRRREGPPAGVLEHVDLRAAHVARSEEHTSELQSRRDLVCRLLLEKKKERADNGRHS